MLPGKTYKPEDILQILRKRYWFLLVPLAVIAAGTAIVARTLPNRYRSETLIMVVPPQISPGIVSSTMPPRVEGRLQSIQQQILSRTRLERIIQDFNLYAEERQTGIMEDIVQKMRDDITVQVVKGDAFRVSYVGEDPRIVTKVTERLASLFIEENLRDREVVAEGTNQFLESQLEEARRRLIEQEKKLEVYRQQHSGELPSQLQSNLQAIQNTEMQIQAVVESINRDRDRRVTLERQLADLIEAPAIVPDLPPATADAPAGGTGSTADQLAAARATLAGLELRFKPGLPDIGLWKRRIRDLEAKAEQEALEGPVSPSAAPRRVSPAEAARQNRIAALRAEIDGLDRQIAVKGQDEGRLRGLSATYQRRIDAAPARESELTELTRDYDTLNKLYSSLLVKNEDSRMARNLERRQIGEQFKLLDPARVPERPFSPNRPLINLFGIAAGLGIGLGLIALLEYRDGSFKTDSEVARVLSLPVLAVVPLMASDVERQRRSRRRMIMGVGLGSTVALCFAVVAYTFLR